MTFRVRKRGKLYRLEGRAGERAKRGAGEHERIRLSLGTMNSDAAYLLHNRIERAMAEGPNSALWDELRGVLPADTFEKLAAIAGRSSEPTPEPAKRTWHELAKAFAAWMAQRVAFDKLRATTQERYLQTSASFGEFLKTRGIVDLDQITKALVEDYKAWRLATVLAKKFSRGGRGVVLDTAILHRIFAYAMECELVAKNPVRLDGRPGDDPTRGAQPFKAAELAKLRAVADKDMLAFSLLRWTGFRGGDAVGLRWGEIDWETHEINRLTQKRRKRILIPICQELFFALEVERDRRKSDVEDRVLVHPITGKPLSRERLYERTRALGKRAGVLDAHPHRFRDTFVVDMLSRGASPYDVAKLIGDTVDTIERHYAPFVRELRERARRIMETGEGLEITGTRWAQQNAPGVKPN
ncbi:MAG: site-specific integrase [Candidatus Acidiferrales bacterium]